MRCRNKSRLYVALYLRGGGAPQDSYHWAILVSPKAERSPLDAMQYHVKNSVMPVQTSGNWGSHYNALSEVASGDGEADGRDQCRDEENLTPWVFEESRLDQSSTRFRLLVRVLVAKIARPEQLESSVRLVKVIQDSDGVFTCRTWVRDVVKRLNNDGVLSTGTAVGNRGSGGGDGKRPSIDWDNIERVCRWYVTHKKEHGRWKGPASTAVISIPTWNMLSDSEVVM